MESFKRVWIMRHSIRTDNCVGPESNCSITPEGVDLAIKQASILSTKITTLNQICTSPFKRTVQTSEAVQTQFKNTPIALSFDLAETLTVHHNNYRHNIPSDFVNYLRENGITFPESDQHIKERCQHLIDFLIKETYENVLLVSHAGLINVLSSLLHPGINYWAGYCSYIAFEWRKDHWHYVESG